MVLQDLAPHFSRLINFIFVICLLISSPVNSKTQNLKKDRKFSFNQFISDSTFNFLDKNPTRFDQHEINVICRPITSKFSQELEMVVTEHSNMEYKNALIILEEALAINPNQNYLQFYKAITLIKLFQFSEAKVLLTGLVEKCPNAVLPKYGLANAYFMQGNLSKAQQYLAEIQKKAYGEVLLHNFKARLLIVKAELNAALGSLNSINKTAITNASSLSLKASIYAEMGMIEEAKNVNDQLRKLNQLNYLPRNSAKFTTMVSLAQINQSLAESNYIQVEKNLELLKIEKPSSVYTYLIAYGAAMEMGLYQQAVTEHKKIKQIAPEYPFLNLLAGRVARAQGDVQFALRYYSQQLDYSPGLRFIYQEMGEIYIESGEYSKAIGFYDRALRVIPKDYFLTTRKAKAYRQTSRYEQALTWYQKAIELLPNLTVAYVAKARVYNSLNKPEMALKSLYAGLNKRPDDMESLTVLAFTLRSQNKIDEALKLAMRAFELYPNSKFTIIELAINYYVAGNQEMATKLCNELRTRMVFSNYDKFHLSYCYEATGRIDDALSLVQSIHKNRPSKLSLDRMVLLYRLQNNDNAAQSVYENWLHSHSKDIDAKIGYANLLYKLKKYDQASQHYADLTRLVGDKYPDLWIKFSISLHRLKMIKETINTLNKAYSLYPKNPEIIEYMAIVYEPEGELVEALHWYKKLAELDTTDVNRRLPLIKFYHRHKLYKEVLVETEKGLKVAPKDITLLTFASYAATNSNQQKKIIEFSSRLRELGAAQLYNLETLGRHYTANRQFVEAEKVYKEAIELKPSSQVTHSNLGYTYYLQGNYKDALSKYEIAITLPPEILGLVHFNRGLALIKLSKDIEARQAFDKAKENGYPP